MPNEDRATFEPHPTHLFDLEIEGIVSGQFQEFSGLSGQNEVFEIKEGGRNSSTHKFVTRGTVGDITLKRGFCNDPAMFDWFDRAAIHSLTERHNGSIILKDDFGSEKCRWRFFNAFPVKWEGPGLNSTSSGIAVESLTLACEWITLELS
jgi:phage tail-like protein